MIFRGKNGKVYGELKGGILSKTVDKKIHKLHALNAYAFDADVIDSAEVMSATKEVRINEKGGKQYKISFDDFLHYAIRIDFGYGKQLAVPLRYWAGVIEQDVLL